MFLPDLLSPQLPQKPREDVEALGADSRAGEVTIALIVVSVPVALKHAGCWENPWDSCGHPVAVPGVGAGSTPITIPKDTGQWPGLVCFLAILWDCHPDVWTW